MAKESRIAATAERLKGLSKSIMSWASSIMRWTQIGFLWLALKLMTICELCASYVISGIHWLKPKFEARLAALRAKTNPSPSDGGQSEGSEVEDSKSEVSDESATTDEGASPS